MPEANDPPSISRRESLKRAAGALALGLGAPAALAATEPDDTAFHHWKFVFYKDPSDRPVGHVTVPDDLVEKLTNEEGFIVIKHVKTVNAESRETQSFDVRRAR